MPITREVIPHLRLQNQRIAGSTFNTPQEAVEWLGAVQSQDYVGAKWALGMRLRKFGDHDLDKAFNDGEILRTHVMRPTWHFVSPRDIRWLLQLTAPRVLSTSAYYLRKLELDAATVNRCNDIMTKELEGNRFRTRAELVDALTREGIKTISHDNILRLTYIVMHAELDGVICSGPRKGKQFTYGLLEERAPDARTLTREESLSELAKRYFTSHGPALIKDFAWWSGLTVADAKTGIEMLGNTLMHEIVDGNTYWFAGEVSVARDNDAHLLSNYDEYTVAYRDHDMVFDPVHKQNLELLFPHSIIIGGRVVGSWRRAFRTNEVAVTIRLFERSPRDIRKIHEAAKRYEDFMGMKVIVSEG